MHMQLCMNPKNSCGCTYLFTKFLLFVLHFVSAEKRKNIEFYWQLLYVQANRNNSAFCFRVTRSQSTSSIRWDLPLSPPFLMLVSSSSPPSSTLKNKTTIFLETMSKYRQKYIISKLNAEKAICWEVILLHFKFLIK